MIDSYRDRMLHVAHEAGIRGSYGDISKVVDTITPFVVCYSTGHNLPCWFLGRFRNRPVRCDRCGSWFVSQAYGGFGGTAWGWKFIGSDDDAPKV